MAKGNCDYCGRKLTIGYEFVKNLEFRYCSLRCLEDSEETTVDTSQASEQVIEMFTALSRKIVSLERQLADTQRNVERQAEELENAKHRISKHATMFGAVEEKVEMLTDDIVTLDSRSQVLNAINKYYAEGNR